MTGKFGTDAVRFTLAAYAAQGRDIKFDEKRVEGYRHFLNKIWNVARFISMNIEEDTEIKPAKELPKDVLSLANRWILSRLSTVCSEIDTSLTEYRFNDSASILYQFIWHELCDWYIELIKPELYGEDKETRNTTISTLLHVYEVALALLHPFMPFITEEIWQTLPSQKNADSLCIRKYPVAEEGIKDIDAETKMGVVMDVVTGIRSIRGELNISPSLELKALIKTLDGSDNILNENIAYITKLARTGEIEIGRDIQAPKNSATVIKHSMEIFVPLEGVIDVDAEIARLTKERDKAEDNVAFVKRKLHNKEFMNKAPKAVIEETKVKYKDYLDKLNVSEESIKKIKQWGKSDGDQNNG
jgi:valyl-tRNA synthetase